MAHTTGILSQRKHRRLLAFILGLTALLAALLAALYAWLAVDLPAPDELYQRRSAPSTRILDRHGQLLYEIIDPHAGRHTPLALDQILNNAATLLHMSGGQLSVPLVIRMATGAEIGRASCRERV